MKQFKQKISDPSSRSKEPIDIIFLVVDKYDDCRIVCPFTISSRPPARTTQILSPLITLEKLLKVLIKPLKITYPTASVKMRSSFGILLQRVVCDFRTDIIFSGNRLLCNEAGIKANTLVFIQRGFA